MHRNTRSVLIIQQFAVPPTEPGITRHVELFGALQNWDFTIIAGRLGHLSGADSVGSPDHFRYINVPHYAGNDWRRVTNWFSFSLKAAAAGAFGPPPSLVYASSPTFLSLFAGYVIARRHRVPLVLEIRDLWPDVLVTMGRLGREDIVFRLLSAAERWIYRRADRLVGVADGWIPHMENAGVSSKYVSIPNGADPGLFASNRSTSIDLRSGLPESSLVLVYAGAHGPSNGLDSILDAATAVRDHRFVLVGGGIEKSRLKQRVADEKLTNVIFLDPVPKAELPGLLQQADVALYSYIDPDYIAQGSPNKVFEYMASGLPIATNIGGAVRDLLESSQAGFHGSTLAEAVISATAASKASLKDKGDRGRCWMLEHRNRSGQVAILQQLLDDLVRA